MTRPRNPWPRGEPNNDGRWWQWWSHYDVHRFHTSLQILLRLRWGARHACARLRAERDAARAQVVELAQVVGSAATERDTALAELRTLRRELAARRAVDGWIVASHQNAECPIEYFVLLDPSGMLRLMRDDGDRAECRVVAPDYPYLADSLGLEWETKDA